MDEALFALSDELGAPTLKRLDTQTRLDERSSLVEGEVFRRVTGSLTLVVRWQCEWATLAENFLVFFASSVDRRVIAAFSLSSIVDVRPADAADALRLRLVVGGQKEEILLRIAEPKEAQLWLRAIQPTIGTQGQEFVPVAMLQLVLDDQHRRSQNGIQTHAENVRHMLGVQLQVSLLKRTFGRILSKQLHPSLHKVCRAGDGRGMALVKVSLGMLHLSRTLRRIQDSLVCGVLWCLHQSGDPTCHSSTSSEPDSTSSGLDRLGISMDRRWASATLSVVLSAWWRHALAQHKPAPYSGCTTTHRLATAMDADTQIVGAVSCDVPVLQRLGMRFAMRQGSLRETERRARDFAAVGVQKARLAQWVWGAWRRSFV